MTLRLRALPDHYRRFIEPQLEVYDQLATPSAAPSKGGLHGPSSAERMPCPLHLGFPRPSYPSDLTDKYRHPDDNEITSRLFCKAFSSGIRSRLPRLSTRNASPLQTVLLGILSSIRHSPKILALSFALNNNAIACQPGQHFNVQFEASSDRLTGSEAGRLGAWVTDMQKTYPNRPFYLLIAYQEEAHPDEEMAERRGQWVKDFLVQMGEDRKAVIYGGTTIWKAENVGPYSTTRPTTLGIEFGPGCPNGCCTADGKPTIVPIGSPD